MHILYVDDDQVSLKIVSKWLLSEGYSATVSTDRGITEGLIEADYYDVYLIDLSMNIVSGFDLATMIKEKFPKKIVIAYTAYSLDERPAMFDKVIQKGCGKDYFISQMRSIENTIFDDHQKRQASS